MSLNWVAEAQTIIYSRVKAITRSEIEDKYPSIYFTESDANPTKTQLPSVYITFAGVYERGGTINGTSINAVDMTVEVHVKSEKTTNGYKANRDIAWTVTEAFKTMGFSATMPNNPISNVEGVYETVSRFSRIIGQGDVL